MFMFRGFHSSFIYSLGFASNVNNGWYTELHYLGKHILVIQLSLSYFSCVDKFVQRRWSCFVSSNNATFAWIIVSIRATD